MTTNDSTETGSVVQRADGTILPQPSGIHRGDEILTATFPEAVWIIPDYLPAGMTILAGRPKIGKSYLAFQIAGAVAAGGRALDKTVKPGRVLYLALEDNLRRLQKRMKEQAWTPEMARAVDFMTLDDFRTKIGFLHKNGWVNLRARIEAENYRLVVVDTLARALMGVKDMNNGQEVTDALSPIQEIGLRLDAGILVNDHHGKARGGYSPDPIADVMNSIAKPAVADTIWGLYHDENAKTYSLAMEGRELDGRIDLAIKRDYMTHTWQLTEDAPGLPKTNPHQAAVLEYLDNGNAASLTELAIYLKLQPEQRGNLYNELTALVISGRLEKNDKKEYYRP